MPDHGHGLTRLQLQAMQVIQELTDRDGVSPSHTEIADELDMASRSSVHRLIQHLVHRGYLSYLPYTARSISILRRVDLPDFTPFEWFLGPQTGGKQYG